MAASGAALAALRSTSWFEKLFGFSEGSYNDTKSGFKWEPPYLTSVSTGRKFNCGEFTTPTLDALRRSTLKVWDDSPEVPRKAPRLSRLSIGDVLPMHADVDNNGCTFQCASQFNCLEFVNSHVTPERGVTGYSSDNTQGPACAIACAPGTVVRNYYAPVSESPTELGQTSGHQINNLDVMLASCSLQDIVKVHNGYTFSTSEDLQKSQSVIDAVGRETLISQIKVGIHADTEVTFASRYEPLPEGETQLVTQVYCSAISCSYSGLGSALWEPVATMVLDAAYEATLWAALANYVRNHGKGKQGSNVVWLTSVGGGVFGNPARWIDTAIDRAMSKMPKDCGLDVRVGVYSG